MTHPSVSRRGRAPGLPPTLVAAAVLLGMAGAAAAQDAELELAVGKSPGVQFVGVGGRAEFLVRVFNDGQVALTDIVVSDPLAPDCNRTLAGPLLPDETLEFTCTVADVRTDLSSAATATGVAAEARTVTGSSLAARVVAGAPQDGQSMPDMSAALVATTDTAAWMPPSSDPAGVAYLGFSDQLLVSDSEINEPALAEVFTGDNWFVTELDGELVDTLTTEPDAEEPTGVTYNPADRHLFVSQDQGGNRIFELDPGPDQAYDTADDVWTPFRSNRFGSEDPEGITYDPAGDALYLADGLSNRFFSIGFGPNAEFDGGTASTDDVVAFYDTAALGITDPEGIAFDTVSGNVFIVGEPTDRIIEVTPTGTLVNTIDISAADPTTPAGMTFGPSSADAAVRSLYIVDRGADEDIDGRVYEMRLPAPPAAAVLLSPSSDDSPYDYANPTFTWERTPGSTWYQLWIDNEATTPRFSYLRWFTAAQAGCDAAQPTCSITLSGNYGGNAVNWYVRTYNSLGLGPWSSGLSYSTGIGPNPGIPVLTSPSGAGAGVMPTFTWQPRAAATWYELWVNDSSGADQPVVRQWYRASEVGCPGGTGTCSITPSVPLLGASVWYVRTFGNDGMIPLYGQWSAGTSFAP